MTYSVYVDNRLIISNTTWDKALDVCVTHQPAHVVLIADRVMIAQWKDGYAVDIGKLPFSPID